MWVRWSDLWNKLGELGEVSYDMSWVSYVKVSQILANIDKYLEKLGEVSFAIFIVGELGEGSLGM